MHFKRECSDFSGVLQNHAQATTNEVIIEEATVWDQNNAPVIIDDTTYIFRSNLTIEEGVNLFLRDGSRIFVEGDLKIEGTKNGQVSFEGLDDKENYAVYANGGKTDIFNANFSYGGNNGCSLGMKKSIFRRVFAQACPPVAALNVSSEKVRISGSRFSYNAQGINILEDGSDVQLEVNTFDNSKWAAVENRTENKVDAHWNCWMRPSGPNYENNPEGRGEKIIGNVGASQWLECGSEFKPVILVPGIGQSWNWEVMLESGVPTNNWDFAPLFNDFDNTIQSFKDRGYEEGRDFFVAHYDWRKDNHESMESFLKPVIEKADQMSLDDKFDIVAHSMGGFVTLEYLYDDSYEDNIDKVILEGSPLLGSSKAYPVWEGGEIPDGLFGLKLYADAMKDKEELRYSFIHDHVPSVKQLLPIYNHIVKNDTGKEVNVWEMQEQNDYLMGLHQKIFENQDNFAFENILMLEGTGVDTSKMVKVDEYDGEDSDKLWKDGKPNPYPLERNVADGDGTVLNESSSGLPMIATARIEGAWHNDILTLSLDEMSDFLEIERPTKEYKLATKDKMVMTFACPIDVKVVSPSGKHVTKDGSTIEGALYHSDGNDDGVKIIEIQDPEDGEYEIEIVGNGEGDFDGFIYKTNGETTSKKEIEGEVVAGQVIGFELSLAGEEFEIEESQVDAVAPTVSISSPQDGGEYLNVGEWAVEYVVQDDVTADENLETEMMLDDEEFVGSELELPLMVLGQHELRVVATDEAGNEGEAVANFTLITDIDSLVDNVSFYVDKGLITGKYEKKFLKHKLLQIKWLLDCKEMFLQHHKFNPAKRARMERLFNRIVDHKIDQLIRHIQRDRHSNIDDIAAARLTEGLKWIIRESS